MAIRTTTIGSYPKPDYVPVPDWFHGKAQADAGRHPSNPTQLDVQCPFRLIETLRR